MTTPYTIIMMTKRFAQYATPAHWTSLVFTAFNLLKIIINKKSSQIFYTSPNDYRHGNSKHMSSRYGHHTKCQKWKQSGWL